MELLPGTEVHARGLRWEVVSSESLGPQTLFRLRGLENAVLGQELDILWPFELIEPRRHELRPDHAAPLTNWLVYHQAFLLEQALGPNALLAIQPGRLRIEPYQLVPVLRAIRMSRVRLFLCDGVGLGKTIQAGMVTTELVARRLAHRILFVSPAGPLLEQWKTEMSQRFGLRLEVIDRAKLEEVRRGTERGSNPFDHIPLGLVSVDFLKQEYVLDQLEKASYDAVIIDEAHHCMDVGRGQDREDSQRRRLAEVLARRSDCLLLLTATPHDGNDRSFASLCELLDPSLVDGRGQLRGELYQPHVVRRLKKHIFETDPKTGRKVEKFKQRIVTPIPVQPDPVKYATFKKLQTRLLDLVAPELRRAFHNKTYADVLAFIALLKRSVSTVAACKATLSVVSDRFEQVLAAGVESQESRRQRRRTLREYLRKQEQFGTVSTEEEEERTQLEAEDLTQQLATIQLDIRRGAYQTAKVSNVVEHLEELIGLADDAESQDPKLDRLIAEIAAIRQAEPRANVLVYSEYVDSQQAAARALKAVPRIGAVLTMSGDDGDLQRAAITERFRNEDNLVLVSTDSAAEGLNLHQRCHHLIHLELPFNPNRLEQRNGRIDRYGQQYDPMVRYLFLRGTFEDRILLRLIAKYERQRARLTFVPNTLGVTTASDAAQARLLKGLMEEDTKLFKEEPTLFDFHEGDEAEGSDEATRELLEEIDRSLKGFEQAARSYAWLGDAGLHAEEDVAREAAQARDVGRQAEPVELAAFVCDAVRLDGGRVDAAADDNHFAIHLPPAWCHGLDDLPGCDPVGRVVRLTTKLDVTSDGESRPVGYLGRAHPLVRRALDRVRNLSFGGMAAQGQDPRASAVRADVPEPTLLFTFLGRVASRAGRELERVLAVQATASDQTRVFVTADGWLPLAEPNKALRTTDLWDKHFKNWGDRGRANAEKAATDGFRPIAETFIAEKSRNLEAERISQRQWLQNRADEITGPGVAADVQTGLFDKPSGSPGGRTVADWQTLADPAERLAAFASDGRQTPSKRSEADGVLRIYQKRIDMLDSLAALAEPEIIPLGVLMLIPSEASHAV
ncbi:MAG: DEAD/DEAH box helicase [Pirellulaceae bacterium]|nr:DEAD/DEAH box helicase [Pirellulaceae bacterium]